MHLVAQITALLLLTHSEHGDLCFYLSYVYLTDNMILCGISWAHGSFNLFYKMCCLATMNHNFICTICIGKMLMVKDPKERLKKEIGDLN